MIEKHDEIQCSKPGADGVEVTEKIDSEGPQLESQSIEVSEARAHRRLQ